MRERAALLEASCERAVIRTFHSFGSWFLRRNAQALGLDSNFVIYDDEDSASLVQAILPNLGKPECRRYASLIARAKDYGLEPDSPSLASLIRDDDFRRVYSLYEERLRGTGNVDFGDLIRLPAKILEKDEAIARRTRQRFRVILVDEYQDSNVAQFLLLQRLFSPATYLCVVGDDDQSIYRFRGSGDQKHTRFRFDFPGHRDHKAGTQLQILSIDTRYCRGRGVPQFRKAGQNAAGDQAGGAKPQLALLDDQDQEVSFCSRIIGDMRAKGASLSDIAILYRTNAQSLAFEKEFPAGGYPIASSAPFVFTTGRR
jgi:Superfamily I DNA and RNA helicases